VQALPELVSRQEVPVQPALRQVPEPGRVDRSGRLRGFRVAVACADTAVIAGGAAAAYFVRFHFSHDFNTHGLGPRFGLPYSVVVVFLVVVWMAWIAKCRGYSRANVAGGADGLRAIVVSGLATMGTVAVIGFLAKSEISRGFLALCFMIGLPALLASRYAAARFLHRLRARGSHCSRVLVVGRSGHVQDLIEVLLREPWAGLLPVGACLPDPDAPPTIMGVPVLGSYALVGDAVRAAQADQVLMVEGAEGFRGFKTVAWQLDDSRAQLVVVPTVSDVALTRIKMQPVAGLPLLNVRLPEFTGPQRVAKRTMDLFGAAVLIVLLAPFLAVIALLIKASSAGPVLYRQTRVGKNGLEFSCVKFRTMVTDADEVRVGLQALNEGNGALFKIRDDPRVTKIGRPLRRYSLDELPQLLNVLRGQMSLVGPRPPLPDEVRQYEGPMRRRLLVTPGLTGLWQVSGRSDLSAADSQRLDLYYVDNWSIASDVLILCKTLRAVVSGEGAY
jgi:exopolysaccharide biosynthesis polyprenyl glycosylphosphotransferase